MHQPSFLFGSEGTREYYRFLTTITWMRQEPLERMFMPGFKGTYKDQVEDSGSGSDLLPPMFDELSVAGKVLFPL
jgi:hypothetical protein